MVRASSISPIFTITVGLCVANAMTGLSGGLLAQYQRSCDINIGTGQVTIALASLIIGETLVGKGSVAKRILVLSWEVVCIVLSWLLHYGLMCRQSA